MRGLAEDGMTMIVVTHAMAFAHDADDTVAFMDAGMMRESGPSGEMPSSARHERTRTFHSRVIGGRL